MSIDRSAILRKQSHAFCLALIAGSTPQDLYSRFFVQQVSGISTWPRITEHGPPRANQHLPFLGRTFGGKNGFLTYFDRLGETLEFISSEHTFPPPEGFVVDSEAVVFDAKGRILNEGARGVVSVEGHATFKSRKTGRSWDEQFMYRLSGFDHKGRIGHWEIWADPLSAFDSIGGCMNQP